MSLKKEFNKLDSDSNDFSKLNDYTLSVRVDNDEVYIKCSYDFLSRVMFTATSEGHVTVTPFSQLDRDVLEFYHGMLKDEGGKPPALPVIQKEEQSYFSTGPVLRKPGK